MLPSSKENFKVEAEKIYCENSISILGTLSASIKNKVAEEIHDNCYIYGGRIRNENRKISCNGVKEYQMNNNTCYKINSDDVKNNSFNL